MANLASWLDLLFQLARQVRVKFRRQSCAEDQSLRLLIYTFCVVGGHLSDADG